MRLWHPDYDNCLCIFKHKCSRHLGLTSRDMVTSVDFYPEEEAYFISGCMDRKLRVWSIPQGCVLKWTQAPSVITTVTFCPGGRLCAAGLSDGQVIFYYSDGLRYFTQVGVAAVCEAQMECRNRHGKDKAGRKVTGISFLMKEKRQYMLVTTNDSRLRVMSLDTFSITTKFKGHVNRSRQLKASLSSDRKYIACGSDNGRVWVM